MSFMFVVSDEISTHTPLAGRDILQHAVDVLHNVISTHTPLAGRDKRYTLFVLPPIISTHTPLAGRDVNMPSTVIFSSISTHTPLAGRDLPRIGSHAARLNFYSHAPRGARLTGQSQRPLAKTFLLTRPSRGATRSRKKTCQTIWISTHTPLAGRDTFPRRLHGLNDYISTHTPLAGRDGLG